MKYSDSGVDINKGNEAVKKVKEKIESTYKNYNGKVISTIGGFCGLVELDDGRVLGTATDGVGSKLLIAKELNKFDTIGIDLVAMCVNDLVVAGVEPSIFLDYIAMGEQDIKRTEDIISGIVEGCNQSSSALLGGEMAEMPGLYRKDDFDVAGFAVGFAKSAEDLITGSGIKSGMNVYGFESSGVHSNGFSLVNKIFSKKEFHKDGLGEELLTPTKIYVDIVKDLKKKYKIEGLSHITGGGLVENSQRILPKGLSLDIDLDSWEWPSIFKKIQEKGNVPKEEMLKVFNCGVGLVAISSDEIKEGIKIGKVV